MHRKFIALIVASAVAVTALSTAPARADEHDVAKILAGLAALAFIGVAIEHNRDNDQPTASYSGRTPPRPIRPRPLPPQVSKYQLPQHCLHRYSVNNGHRRLFGKRCLNNNYRHTASLPYACQFQFKDGRETRTGYEPRCLRERGYRFARR